MNDQAPQAGQQVQIGPDQVIKAATAGLSLLNTPGAVNVPGPMAISGDIQLLNAVLTAIVQGQVVLGNPITPEGGEQPPSANDSED